MWSTLYREFKLSFLVTFACLALAYFWGQRWDEGPLAATWVTLVLGTMEANLSFDNAVVNASILTGTIGVAFIIASLASSIAYRRRQAAAVGLELPVVAQED